MSACMSGTSGSRVLSSTGDMLVRCWWSVWHVYVFGSGWRGW